jgi:hypothetical protein
MFSSAFLGIHGVVAEQGSCFVVEETRIWILPTSMMVELPCAAGAGIVSFGFLLAHSLPNLVQKCFLFFSFSFVSLFCQMKERGFFLYTQHFFDRKIPTWRLCFQECGFTSEATLQKELERETRSVSQ